MFCLLMATKIHVQHLITACINYFFHGVTEIPMYVYGTAVAVRLLMESLTHPSLQAKRRGDPDKSA